MQLTNLIAAAGLVASTATAFLLPPEISQSDSDIINTLPVPIRESLAVPASADSLTIKLNCPGCPVRTWRHHKGENGKPKIKTDVPSYLRMNFTLEHDKSGSARLLVNDFELYPNSDPFRSTLMAEHLPDFTERRKKRPHHFKGVPPSHLETLGFGLRTSKTPTTTDDNLEMVLLDLQIIEVDNAFVDGIPNLEIKLIKFPTGDLAIGSIETTESETIQKTPMDKQEECTTLLCKWRAVIMQQLARLRPGKGCHGRKGAHGGVSMDSDFHARPGHRVGAHRVGHHGHHGHHAHRHSWGQLWKNIGSHILLPIAIGIMAGVGASILGMLVGTCIVYTWRRFFRGGAKCRHHRRGHSTHKSNQREAAAPEEKSGLMAEEVEVDAPPAYADEAVAASEDKKSEPEA